MKIAKRDLAIVMVLVGIIAAFCAYKFYYSSNMEQVESEESKQASLETQIRDLEKKAKDVENMKKEEGEWIKTADKLVSKYDPAYVYEDGILWMSKVEQDNDETYIRTYTVGETRSDQLVVGEGLFKENNKNYIASRVSYSFSYEVPNYEALKSIIAYLTSAEAGGVRTIDTMTFTQNKEKFFGTINMNVYAFTDDITSYLPPVIKDVEGKDISTGIEMIFPKLEEEKETDNKEN